MRSFLSAALLTMALVAGTAACSGDSSDEPAAASVDLTTKVVTTDNGTLRGVNEAGYRSFLGIPYAAPPVGPLRWRPPVPAAKWSGERDATRPGAACTQEGSLVSGGDSGSGSTTEDCLFLNVYTPTEGTARRTLPEQARDGKLPVMVWIHGGSYTSGAGSDYGPARLVTEGGVIVVTINYRLGALGFLALPQLSAEQELGSGTYGLLDQQAALRWVRSNITKFGGDAQNVTLFGESAGGGSVCAQMVSSQAKGLFAKAIAESGCALRGPAVAAAEKTGASFATKLGCSGADVLTCLRAKTPTQIRAASNVAGTSLTYAPASGTPVLPTDMESAFAKGAMQDVPLLQGTNHDEGRLFILSLGLSNLGPELYPTALRRAVGSVAPQIAARYPLSKYGSTGDTLAAIVTDATFACPALRTNTSAAKRGTVYAYEFNDPNSPLPKIGGFPLKAAHAAELPYLFDMKRLGAVPAGSQKLSKEMVAYWTSFALDGDPNTDGAPKWEPFSPGGAAMQSLVPAGSAALPSTSFATEHNCDFWAAHPDVALKS